MLDEDTYGALLRLGSEVRRLSSSGTPQHTSSGTVDTGLLDAMAFFSPIIRLSRSISESEEARSGIVTSYVKGV